MTTYSRSANLLLQLIYVAFLQGFEAQNPKVLTDVRGYLGQDVTLLCPSIQPSEANISQVEWNLLQPGGNKITIIVVNEKLGENIPDSPLKGRFKISKHALTILDVNLTDAGWYTCKMATFPLGPLEQTTKLIVQTQYHPEECPAPGGSNFEQMSLSPGIISAIVTTVVLLLMIITAMVYLFFIRKWNSSARHCVLIDTAGPLSDVTRPSVIRRDEEVVYSDVTHKTHNGGTRSSNNQRRDAEDADNVTYSEVIISPQQYISPSVHI